MEPSLGIACCIGVSVAAAREDDEARGGPSDGKFTEPGSGMAEPVGENGELVS